MHSRHTYLKHHTAVGIYYIILGGSVEQQVGCHLVSSVLLDSPVPNYLSHTPRHMGVALLKRLRKFEISIFITFLTSPASTATRAPLAFYCNSPCLPPRAI